MDSPERSRNHGKKEIEDSVDGKREMTGDEDELEGNGRRRHRLSKSRRSSNGEEVDGWDGSGRRKSGDRNESRRTSAGSTRGDIDEGEYDAKKDSGSKPARKKQEVSALEKLSNWYQDGDLENRHDGGDKSVTRSHIRSDDNERNTLRKSTSKFSDHEPSHRSSRSRDERARDVEDDKALEKDSYHSERRETSRDKGPAFTEEVKNRRRWDDSDTSTKAEDTILTGKSEPRGGTMSESKNEAARERSTSTRLDTGEGREKVLEITSDKGKSYSREEKRIDSDRSKSRRSDAVEEDGKASSGTREDKIGKEKTDRHKELKSSAREAVDNRDRSTNLEEDVSPWIRDKNAREVGHARRSGSPERSGRHRHELENSEMEYERGSSLKRKDVEKDGFRDDRAKTRENSWSDRNREREGSRESWKRRQQLGNERDMELVHDRDRDRDFPRRGRDRMDNDRGLGRTGNRKDGRSEAVKASSNFGISTENYDVIEIQPKPLDYGRDDPGSGFTRRTEAVPLHDPKPNKHDDWGRTQDDLHRADVNGATVDDSSVKYIDESASLQDQNAWRDDADGRGGRQRGQQGSLSSRSVSQSSAGGSQPPNNQESNNFGRIIQQGPKGNRPGRGGRIRPPGRDNQQVNIPVPLMGSPFGHLGMPPPGPMQSMNPGLSPGPGPPVPPGIFVSPFSPPVVWPGGRGVDMSMLPVSPGVSSLPPGPGQRFPPNMGAPPNPGLFFNQPGQGRGVPSSASGPGFNAIMPVNRGNLNDKSSGGWVPPKGGGPPGKAPSRGEQNDYSQNFVDTGLRPQNFIRELELTNVEDYPKLRELIQKKDEIVAKAATPPMYHKCDLREFVLSAEFFGTKFDVILVDPPWEEYVHRAPGVTDHMEYWTFEEIMNLKIEAIADTPSFIFLWVGDGVGLEQGRQCLKKWGFRRCEDICWVKTNKNTATPALRHDSHTLFQHSKEHCLMGIKGTVRRSTDGHIIHANIDTDVIIAEEPPYGSTAKPDEMYRIIEHFALGRRRIELFGEDHNIRSGWLTVGKELSSSNFNVEAYMKTFSDKEGKVWLGGGGRNPPPDAPHLVQTTPEIEALRPKSPMKNQQQMQQQQSNSISLTTANSSNRRAAGNSPQNPPGFSLNQEASSSNHPAPWAPQMEGFKGPNENVFDMYGYNMHPMPANGEFLDFEAQRMMNMM